MPTDPTRARLRAGLAAAALLALAACGQGTTSTEPTPTDPTSTDPTSTEPTPTEPPPAERGLARFDATTGSVIRADGTQVELDLRGQVLSFATLPDGRMVFVSSPDDALGPPVGEVSVLDAQGQVRGRYEAWGWQLVADAERTAVAWIGPDGAPYVLAAGAEEPAILATDKDYADGESDPLHLRGDCETEAGCFVIALSHANRSGSPIAYQADSFNDFPDIFGTDVVAVAPDGDAFLQVTVNSEEPGDICVGLWHRSGIGGEADPPASAEACGYNAFEFSPDGRHVAAWYGEGYGATSMAILDARTLEPVAEIAEPGATYHDATWEDPDSLVVRSDVDQAGIDSQLFDFVRLGTDAETEPLEGLATLLESR